MYLVFDCETSGFSESRLLQLGCQLLASDFTPIMQAALLVRPDNWQIEEGATKVHGITQEHALAFGLPVEVVLGVFCGLATKAKTFVGHNLQFDMGIVDGELRKAQWPVFTHSRFCTKQKMTPVCKLPPTEKMLKAGRTHYKEPKLIEAYRYAFGEDFSGAHDAMVDCVATARLFKWLMEQDMIASWKEAPAVKVVYEPVCTVLKKPTVAFAPPPPPPFRPL